MSKKLRELPGQMTLAKLLKYDSESGKLFWRSREPSDFQSGPRRSAEHKCANWNSKNAGKEAFTAGNGRHLVGAIGGKLFLAHRIIWVLVTGEVPGVIDHINGDGTDNRIVNLRATDQQTNSKNNCRSSANTSGATGVSFHKESQKWRAYITVDAHQVYLGLFEKLSDAVRARHTAEEEFGFHHNHGRSPQKHKRPGRAAA